MSLPIRRENCLHPESQQKFSIDVENYHQLKNKQHYQHRFGRPVKRQEDLYVDQLHQQYNDVH